METLIKSITTKFKEYITSDDFTNKQKRILLEHLLELHSSIDKKDIQHKTEALLLKNDIERLKEFEKEYVDLWTRVL
tara:strand:- start:4784 stop:5014 length:231 start_codon:yes stop_codon:yes gene_type:complete